jgi:hypothetical protein
MAAIRLTTVQPGVLANAEMQFGEAAVLILLLYVVPILAAEFAGDNTCICANLACMHSSMKISTEAAYMQMNLQRPACATTGCCHLTEQHIQVNCAAALRQDAAPTAAAAANAVEFPQTSHQELTHHHEVDVVVQQPHWDAGACLPRSTCVIGPQARQRGRLDWHCCCPARLDR